MVKVDPENVLGRTRIENAAYVIDQVKQLGFEPEPNCRLSQMHRCLSRGFIPWGDAEFFTALEAERDMQQLGFIFDQLGVHRENPKFRKLVKTLLQDSVLPQDDRDSHGRDTQFELYLAAVCHRAGLLPVDYDEPDVTCTVGGKKFGIAAKRLKSGSSHSKHIRKAKNQIENQKLPGIIALELSLAWNKRNVPIISPIQSQLHELDPLAKSTRFFDLHHGEILRRVTGSEVRAVVAFEFRIRQRPNREWGLDGMTCWLQAAHDENGIQEYEVFYDAFMKGVPNVTHLNSSAM